jgi:hypothetical protein
MTPKVAAESAEPESDVDATGDDEDMNATQDGTEGNMSSQINDDGAGERANGGLLMKGGGVKPLTDKLVQILLVCRTRKWTL